MTKASQKQNVVAIGVGALTLQVCAALAAPQGGAGEATVQDVVVQAEHDRVEAQKTPQTIVRFDEKKLRDLTITNTRDLAGYVPGLTQFRTGVTTSNSNYFFRGIGEYDPQGQPSVGVYLDDAYFPRLLGSRIELLDVERIDARPGPQDTSSPHNAEAGVVQIVTRKPDNRKRVEAEAGYGNYNEWKVGALVSGPIIQDELFGSLSYSHRVRDGVTRNLLRSADVNNVDLSNALAKLRWTPIQPLEVLLAFDGEFDDGQAKSYNNLAIPGNTSSTAYYPLCPLNHFQQYGGALTISYQLDADLQLKSITQARRFEQVALYDNTSDLWARSSNWLHYRDRNYTQEFRIIGDYGRLDFKAGVYLNRDEWFSGRRANAFGTVTSVFAVPQIATTFQPNWQELWQYTNTYAVYGEANYRLTDELKLTLGGRYNYEKQWNNNYNYSLVNGQTTSSLLGGGFATTDWLAAFYNPRGVLNWSVQNSASWGTGSPKAVLSYQATPEILTYASFSQGHKDGGFDFRAQGPTIASVTQASVPYKPETLTTYEFGVKSSWLDQRLSVAVSAFWNDFRNVQATAIDPVTNSSHRFSAGHGRSKGVEGQATFTPIDEWEIGATGSYLDAVLDYYAGTTTWAVWANSPFGPNVVVPTAAHSGSRLPYSPKFQGSLYTNYRVPLDVPGVWKIGASVQAQTSLYTDIINNPYVKIPSQTFANLQTSYTTADGHWTFQLAVKNLFDRRYPQSYTYQAISTGRPGAGLPAYWTVSYNDPRSIFASVRYVW
jgi:iron complex outermembrane receptor protein